MPIEQTSFREVSRERAVPLPPGELVTTAGTLERLKVPDEVLLRPENVVPFLAGQSVKFNEIVNRPEVKALDAEIPEYIHQDNAVLQASAVSREERAALDGWHADLGKALVKAQSGEVDTEELLRELENLFNDPDIRERLGHAPAAPGGAGPDPFETMFTSQMIQETEEQKRKWAELIAAAKSPEMVNVLLNYRKSQFFTKIIGQLMEAQKFHIDATEQLRAKLDLGMQDADGLSPAELAKFNADFSSESMDSSQIFQQIQYALGNMERLESQVPQINRTFSQGLERMIQNMKAGG